MIGDLKLEFRGREIGDVNTSQMIGDVAIDLNGGSLRLGTNTLNISNVIGDTTVLIPASFSTKISAKAIVGDLRLDGRREEGIFPKLEYADDNYDQATDRLLVKIGGVIGDVGMQRT
jgi:predicted membrane protein